MAIATYIQAIASYNAKTVHKWLYMLASYLLKLLKVYNTIPHYWEWKEAEVALPAVFSTISTKFNLNVLIITVIIWVIGNL